MPRINLVYRETLTAGGGTINLDTSKAYSTYIFDGTFTLLSNIVIQPDGTVSKDMVFEIIFRTDIDLNGNTITLFGETITQDQISSYGTFKCIYNGSKWVIDYVPARGWKYTSGIDVQTLTGGGGATQTVSIDDSYSTTVILKTAIDASDDIEIPDPSTLDSNVEIIVKDAEGDATATNFTITPASGTINGAASVTVNGDYDSVRLIHDGTNYFTI